MRAWRLVWPDAALALELGDRTRVDIALTWGGQLLVVRDHDAPPPGAGTFDIRSHGLWLSLVCETPDEHWTVGLEAFALAVDHPDDDRGHLVPLGLDVEWEAPGRVHGELLVGDERVDLDVPATLTVT